MFLDVYEHPRELHRLLAFCVDAAEWFDAGERRWLHRQPIRALRSRQVARQLLRVFDQLTLREALESKGVTVEYMANHVAATAFPSTASELAAFDVVMPQPIPGKGEVLTRVSNFWFARTGGIVPNHLSGRPLAEVVPDEALRSLLGDRAVVVRRLRPLPVEAIVRGYLIGSGWKDYQQNGAVCGIELPAGLQLADKLPQAIYTPSTKAAIGGHDQNIDFAATAALIGRELAARGGGGGGSRNEAAWLRPQPRRYAKASSAVLGSLVMTASMP